MYDDITPESIKTEIFAGLKTDIETREGSFVNDITSPLAVEIYKVYTGLRAALPMFYIDETSGEYIDKQAAWYGIIRKKGTHAQAVLLFTGTDETVITAGAIFTTAGGMQFETLEDVKIAGGKASAAAQSKETGACCNIPAGLITQQYISIAGVSGVTNTAAVGGTNPETDASLIKRLDAYRQRPAASGNAYNYEQWALEVEGVGAAKVFPAAAGSGGRVTVLIAGDKKQPVESAVVAACAAHLEKCRPVCVELTTESTVAHSIKVTAQVKIESSAIIAQIAAKFSESLRGYLESIAFVKYEIPYNRIAYMLLDIDGVIDYTQLTINGAVQNIALTEKEVPVLGEVIIT
ncbi:MAG: baseplate J/gp47 family protein [Hydrogenoanaerobacterium sp.]